MKIGLNRIDLVGLELKTKEDQGSKDWGALYRLNFVWVQGAGGRGGGKVPPSLSLTSVIS